MEKKLLNDQELENIGCGRKWRDSEQKDYKATAGKFMDYYNALMKAGRYEEARELVSIYTVHSGAIYDKISEATDDSEDILFSKIMEPYWPKNL